MTNKGKTQYGSVLWSLDVGDRLVKSSRYGIDQIVTITRVTKTQAMYEIRPGYEQKLRREASQSANEKTPFFKEVSAGSGWHSTRYRPEIATDESRITEEKKLQTAKLWFANFKPSPDQILSLYRRYYRAPKPSENE